MRVLLPLRIFGVYLSVIGLVLMVAPMFLIGLFGFDPVPEPWGRVIGTLAFAISILYWALMRSPDSTLVKATVIARVFVFAAFATFVVLGFAKPMLVLFGATDFVFAIWTWMSLRADAAAKPIATASPA